MKISTTEWHYVFWHHMTQYDPKPQVLVRLQISETTTCCECRRRSVRNEEEEEKIIKEQDWNLWAGCWGICLEHWIWKSINCQIARRIGLLHEILKRCFQRVRFIVAILKDEPTYYAELFQVYSKLVHAYCTTQHEDLFSNGWHWYCLFCRRL